MYFYPPVSEKKTPQTPLSIDDTCKSEREICYNRLNHSDGTAAVLHE